MHETELFRIKYQAMDKVAHLFGEASQELKKVIGHYNLPSEVREKRAKIFRGENYLQLPYVVMDYPALFGTENIFAYRTMYWWGNFFSFTIQLSGEFLHMYKNSLLSNIGSLAGKNIYFCINSTPWQYHYEAENYVSVDEVIKKTGIIEKQISERNFIKLSRSIKISEWDNLSQVCAETFQQFMQVAGMSEK